MARNALSHTRANRHHDGRQLVSLLTEMHETDLRDRLRPLLDDDAFFLWLLADEHVWLCALAL